MAQKPRPPLPPLGLGRPDEFSSLIGDRQQLSSGTRIMALARAPNAPAVPRTAAQAAIAKAAAVSLERQVVSTFDTRPIDAFDFTVSFTTQTTLDPPEPFGDFEVPQNYVCVLRRVEFTVFPAYAGTGISDPLIIQLTRNGSGILLNRFEAYGIFDSGGWDTHQVFGFWEKPGVIWEAGDAALYDIAFRMSGNLILAKNIPPNREIGSDPIRTRGA